MKQRKNRSEFKKVDSSPLKSDITPMDPEKVEDEVLEAVKEAKEEEKKPEMAEVTVHGKKYNIELPEKMSDLSEEGQKNLKRVLDGELSEPPKKAPKKENKPADGRMLRRMRLRDRSFNKTCAVCLRRVDLADIGNGKAEICDQCK